MAVSVYDFGYETVEDFNCHNLSLFGILELVIVHRGVYDPKRRWWLSIFVDCNENSKN